MVVPADIKFYYVSVNSLSILKEKYVRPIEYGYTETYN